MRKRTGLILASILIVLLITILQPKKSNPITGILPSPPGVQTGTNIGDYAPLFALESASGAVIFLQDFQQENPVLVNFWASWCPPCVHELPLLQDVAENTDVVVLGINLQENKQTAQAFFRELSISYPLLLDPNGEVKNTYGVFTQPVTYFVDKDGIIQDRKFGPLTTQELAEKLKKIQ